MVHTLGGALARRVVQYLAGLKYHPRHIPPKAPKHHPLPRQNEATQVLPAGIHIIQGHRAARIHHHKTGPVAQPGTVHTVPAIGAHTAGILVGIAQPAPPSFSPVAPGLHGEAPFQMTQQRRQHLIGRHGGYGNSFDRRRRRKVRQRIGSRQFTEAPRNDGTLAPQLPLQPTVAHIDEQFHDTTLRLISPDRTGTRPSSVRSK